MPGETNGQTEQAPAPSPLGGVTKLYRHDCRYNCCPKRWSKFADHDSAEEALTKETASDPIVHRHTFRDTKWFTKSFTVHSPAMRTLLRAALAKYQDFDLELENWTFKPPYKPVVHRWDRLNSLCTGAAGTDAEPAAKMLMDFLRPILADSVEALARTKETGKVTFEDVWQIFPPGELVMTTFFGVEAACRVVKYERVDPGCDRPPYWVISLEYLDWNGEYCGFTDTTVTIRYFDGYHHVVSLPVYPLCFNAAADEIKTRVTRRGRTFESLRGYHFKTSVGRKILLETEKPEERPVDGRVIIDAFAYYLTSNIVRPELRLAVHEEDSGSNGSDTASEASEKTDSDSEESAEVIDIVDGPEMTASKGADRSLTRAEKLDALTDEQCLLATPWVKGLDLKTKEWAQFQVDSLSSIVWNDAAFDHLVLPGQEKQLAWAFVENKALANNNFDDFVQDKGRGIIILMFGPPGVGKTFTAEAVAERARVPLYGMSAGTLGTKPKDVEVALDRALDLCKLWNAMLLLDEADVFLGARTTTDLARNELVAVFLTKLEYYQGICFLTTNRMASLDHAFQSRVDLFLPYADLTVDARRRVWEGFIKQAGGSEKFDVSSEDLDKLAESKLNGREIKNLIKSAHLLSLKDSAKIGIERLSMLCENRARALAALDEQHE